MGPKLFLRFFFLIFILLACKPEAKSVKVEDEYYLEKKGEELFYLNLKGKSLEHAWKLEVPVFQLQEGDVDRDGSVDALVGVIKPTHFDTVSRRRLFIFKNHSGFVRPMWLGSRLAHSLLDFRFIQVNHKPYILTMEVEKSGISSYHLYHWRGFGLEYVKQL